MSRLATASFTTASVGAASFLNHNESINGNFINILKVKVVPSVVGVTSEVQIYEKDTFLDADLIWGTNPFAGTEFDPIQKDAAGVVTETNKGHVVPYQDQDSSNELHIKFVNNDSQAKTYTVTVEYELVNVFDEAIVFATLVNDVDAQNDTLLAADINGGITVHTSVTGGGTITTDTATNIIATCQLNTNGETIKMYYINDGTQTLTFAGGTGVTIADTGNTILTNESAVLLFRRVTSTTVTVYVI